MLSCPTVDEMRNALEMDELHGPHTHAERAALRGGSFCYPGVAFAYGKARNPQSQRLKSALFLEQFDSPRRANTAVHEAGHAVAAVACRFEIKSASIVPDEKSLGRVQYEFDSAREQHEHAIVQLAGFAAVNHLTGTARFNTSKSDLRETAKHADPTAVLLDAKQIIQRRWPDVLMVAAALLARNVLTGVEIECITERNTLPGGAAWWRGKPAGYWESPVS